MGQSLRVAPLFPSHPLELLVKLKLIEEMRPLTPDERASVNRFFWSHFKKPTMKKFTSIELLVTAVIAVTLITAVIGAWKNKDNWRMEYMPDGTTVYTVTINGHDYLKTDSTLTHSASCAACTQKEQP